ncbi:MAG: sigma-70 family RNA polymerase sigma factor [Methyloglobulus sp.]|nr:sigma-70 family RNA polymerase sigma factor [Methyloglobulus sp.]
MLGFTPDAAATLIERHRQELLRHLLRRVACPDTANDLLHDTYLRLVNYRSSEPVNNTRAFVYRIADNIATDHLRKNKLVPVELPEPDGDEIIDRTPLPEQAVFAQQQLELCEQVLKELSPSALNIFLLSRYEGYTHVQIAQELDVSISWVEKSLFKTMKLLRKAIKNDEP